MEVCCYGFVLFLLGQVVVALWWGQNLVVPFIRVNQLNLRKSHFLLILAILTELLAIPIELHFEVVE